MRSKIVTADEAIALIRDGDTLASTGFVQTGFTEALLSALEHCFLTTGSPRNLALFAAGGQGDGKTLGLNHLGHEGLLRRVVAGHWGRMPTVAKLALDNRIQAYNLPQGIICQLFRNLAQQRHRHSPGRTDRRAQRAAATPGQDSGHSGRLRGRG